MVKIISNIKDKIRYERDKAEKIEKKIIKIGGCFNSQLVRLDVNLQVIKGILFKEKKITEEEYELEYLKKVQVILKDVLKEIEKAKRKQARIIIPKANLPKDLRGGFKA